MSYSDDDIDLDFDADWIALLRGSLQQRGYTPAHDDQDVSFQYFNVEKRLVQPTPRVVHVAPELSCPADVRDGYEAVCRKVTVGDDVRPHLSSRLADLDFNDALLNDWGIHHLHLSTEHRSDGFVKRTGPVLFARFEPDDAYFIGIKQHGNAGPLSSSGAVGPWTDKEMLEVLLRNWPSMLASYRLNGLTAGTPDDGFIYGHSEETLAKARRVGMQLAAQLSDGSVYAPLGGGYSTSGLATEVVMRSDMHRRLAHEWQDKVVAGKERFLTALHARGKALAPRTRFRLAFDTQGRPVAVATSTDGKPVVWVLEEARP